MLTAKISPLVRESVDPSPDTSNGEKATVPASDATVLLLNATWRVRDDGGLQWILERQHSKPGKPEKWCGHRFHVERDPLLRSIGALCGDVAPAAVALIATWPRMYERP